MKAKVYFPNLNGLRFIAAIMVLLSHIEQLKGLLGVKKYNYLHPMTGRLGVILFFVLSGFLITYLLIHEKEQTNTIALKKFYIRRGLRIYPLYYLIILLAFLVLPSIGFFNIHGWGSETRHDWILSFLLHIFFFPNLAIILFLPIIGASQVWSVGVEEQFYFIWAILMKKMNNLLLMLVSIIIIYLCILALLLMIKHKLSVGNRLLDITLQFWSLFKIDCMAIGGLGAYILYHQKQRTLSFLYNKYTQIMLYTIVLILFVTGFIIDFVNEEVFAVCYAMIIINLAGNKHSIINLENKLLNYGGRYSYGIYLFHPLAIIIAIRLSAHVLLPQLFIYAISFMLTCVAGMLSYELYEKPFIKAKVKFSSVISGDNVSRS